MDYWFGAPFHAIGMLRAGLDRTAFAQDSTYAGMDVISGYSSSVRSSTPIVAVGTRTALTGAVPDGSAASVSLARLAGGSDPGRVTGSDGTSVVLPLDVPTCPAYQAVRVAIDKVGANRLRVRLDNSRNSRATRFRVVVGGDEAGHRVPAAAVKRVQAPLHRATRVRVYVGEHLVARDRLR